MQRAIDLIKNISKDLKKDWKDDLRDYNMPDTFQNIYSIASVEDANRVICFIVYAYSPDSLWLDLKKDRLENKLKILNNMDANANSILFQDVITNKNEISGMAIFDFLEGLKSWKWRAIFDLLDYSSKMFRFATTETESEKTFDKMNKEGEVKTLTQELDIDLISKVNKEKGLLLDQAIAKRKQADILLEEIRKEFYVTDTVVQQDLGFNFTDTSKRKDILSWRDYIKGLNDKKQQQN